MKLLYFAAVREAVGVAEEERDLPPSIGTVAALLAWWPNLSPRHAKAFAAIPKLHVAVNQALARHDDPVTAGDEIALFPPMTGG